MTRKPLMVVTTLSVGLLFYTAFAGMIMARTTSLISTLSSSPPPAPWIANGALWFFGWWIPLRVVLIVASIAPTWLILSEVFTRVRRHNREVLGQCLGIGVVEDDSRAQCRQLQIGLQTIAQFDGGQRIHAKCEEGSLPIGQLIGGQAQDLPGLAAHVLDE